MKSTTAEDSWCDAFSLFSPNVIYFTDYGQKCSLWSDKSLYQHDDFGKPAIYFIKKKNPNIVFDLFQNITVTKVLRDEYLGLHLETTQTRFCFLIHIVDATCTVSN